jgi:L-histidine Nalpha-methyltransferase
MSEANHMTIPNRLQEESLRRIEFLVRHTDDPLASDGANVIAGLLQSPKRISPVYVYDKRGTEFFERQCNTPEYYLRRAEAGLLKAHAADILDVCGCIPIVELGAGTARKTRCLLTEYQRRGYPCVYFPIDVDTETLQDAMTQLAGDFPGVWIYCLGATYDAALPLLPACSRDRLFLFLGSSLGNMSLEEMDGFLAQLSQTCAHGDFLLLGVDLDKDRATIDAAYNDAAGYGAQSTLNMLHHLNRRYAGDFDVSRFRYRSRYNAVVKCNEVAIESLVEQTVTLASLNFTVAFQAGEPIDAEIMWKFDPEELTERCLRARFVPIRRWVDPAYRYGLFLLRRR